MSDLYDSGYIGWESRRVVIESMPDNDQICATVIDGVTVQDLFV